MPNKFLSSVIKSLSKSSQQKKRTENFGALCLKFVRGDLIYVIVKPVYIKKV